MQVMLLPSFFTWSQVFLGRIYRFGKVVLKRNLHEVCVEFIILFDSRLTAAISNIHINMKITLPVTDGVI